MKTAFNKLAAGLALCAALAGPCSTIARAQEEQYLSTPDGTLSFALSPSSWTVETTTGATAFRRHDSAFLLAYPASRLLPEQKSPQTAPLLVRNSLCRKTKCSVSPVAERFATNSGPAVYRTTVSDEHHTRKVYLVQTDSYYFAAEQSGLDEESLLVILSSATVAIPTAATAAELPAPPVPVVRPYKLRPQDLFPTPRELAQLDGWILGAQALALAALALLGLRLLLSQNTPSRIKTEENSPYPVTIEKKYLRISDTFFIRDAQRNAYRFVSADPALLLKAGLGLFVLAKVAGAVATTVLGPSDAMLSALAAAPRYALLLAASGLLSALSYKRSFRMTSLRDGAELLSITPGLSPSGRRVFHVHDANDKLVSIIEQESTILARRRWRLKDTDGNTHIELVEDSAHPALARKLLGHCWGLLRSAYIVQERYGAVGEIKTDTISHLHTIRMGYSATDHRIIAATAAVVYLVTPDSWHPWFA